MTKSSTRHPLHTPGYYRRIPLLPHQLTDDITSAEDAIVLCHLGIPRIDRDDWTLDVGGLVERPRRLSFEDLLSFERHGVETVHQCAGSPLAPFEPTRRVCNLHWAGARLTDILSNCGVSPQARFLWAMGADYGEFGGLQIDCYLKDLPIERWNEDVLLAYELNDAPLLPEHGFPVRLVVPGFYGTNSVKWLTRLDVAATRVKSPFTTVWYNDPVLDAQGRPTGETMPVWSIKPESVIVSPAPQQRLALGAEIEVWGRAWADSGIEQVEIDLGDSTWVRARLQSCRGRAWQRFSFSWKPARSGLLTLRSRARAANGELQPEYGRRNAIHSVTVEIA